MCTVWYVREVTYVTPTCTCARCGREVLSTGLKPTCQRLNDNVYLYFRHWKVMLDSTYMTYAAKGTKPHTYGVIKYIISIH